MPPTIWRDRAGAEIDDRHDQDGLENERRLWGAVLLQALLDASRPTKPRETSEIRVIRSQALSLFSCSVGVTADHFDDMCHLAGFDPFKFRAQAWAVIRSGNPIIRKRLSSILSGEEVSANN